MSTTEERKLPKWYRGMHHEVNALKNTTESNDTNVVGKENYPAKEIKQKQKQIENDNNNNKYIYVEENEPTNTNSLDLDSSSNLSNSMHDIMKNNIKYTGNVQLSPIREENEKENYLVENRDNTDEYIYVEENEPTKENARNENIDIKTNLQKNIKSNRRIVSGSTTFDILDEEEKNNVVKVVEASKGKMKKISSYNIITENPHKDINTYDNEKNRKINTEAILNEYKENKNHNPFQAESLRQPQRIKEIKSIKIENKKHDQIHEKEINKYNQYLQDVKFNDGIITKYQCAHANGHSYHSFHGKCRASQNIHNNVYIEKFNEAKKGYSRSQKTQNRKADGKKDNYKFVFTKYKNKKPDNYREMTNVDIKNNTNVQQLENNLNDKGEFGISLYIRHDNKTKKTYYQKPKNGKLPGWSEQEYKNENWEKWKKENAKKLQNNNVIIYSGGLNEIWNPKNQNNFGITNSKYSNIVEKSLAKMKEDNKKI